MTLALLVTVDCLVTFGFFYFLPVCRLLTQPHNIDWWRNLAIVSFILCHVLFCFLTIVSLLFWCPMRNPSSSEEETKKAINTEEEKQIGFAV